MSGTLLQSTLRELKVFALSRNLWLVFACVVVLFTMTGPFETMERMSLAVRFGYWLIVHATAWSIAILCVVLGDVLLADRISSILGRMMAGAVFSAVPIGILTESLDLAWNGTPLSSTAVAIAIVEALPLSVIFCGLSYLAMSGQIVESSVTGGGTNEDETHSTPARPDIPVLARLKPDNRGRLLHIEVEDHYSRIRTSRGQELVLLRFSDALRETGSAAGMQVHRSHWVADEFVSRLRRADGRLTLELADGSKIPVSRTHAASVRARFG